MAIFRQYVAPLLIVLVFLVALVAVGIRGFLPSDMAAPAPVEEVSPQASNLEKPEAKLSASTRSLASLQSDPGSQLPASLSTLIKGLPDEPALSGQLGVRVN